MKKLLQAFVLLFSVTAVFVLLFSVGATYKAQKSVARKLQMAQKSVPKLVRNKLIGE